MSAPFFVVDDIHLSFGGVKAITGASLSVEKGTLTALLGPNGAGKTSLLNCINGFYRPSKGSIRIEGQEILGRRPHAISLLGVARTFQNVEVLGRSTVLQNVLLGRHIFMPDNLLTFGLGLGARIEAENRRRALEIMDFLGLADQADVTVGGLPYGRQKLVEIARALAMEPTLLLLDEPTSGMTPDEKHRVAEVIRNVGKRLGVTQILIEHDMAFINALCERVVVLDFGKDIAAGLTRDVFRMPKVIEAYLGIPPADDAAKMPA